MSGGPSEPRLSRRTVTMDETKVVREVAKQSILHPVATGRLEAPQALPVRNYAAAPPVAPIQQSTQQLSTLHPSHLQPSHLQPLHTERPPVPTLLPPHSTDEIPAGCTVLVINASQNMAHEITLELSRTLPGSTILFAPTLGLALWILKRRQIDLILSSSILPDGALGTLHEFIQLMSPHPELVVISDLHSTRAELGSHPGYRFVELRRVSTRQGQGEETQVIAQKISALGADIRNDLNNPLQEIVAMAFVAHASQGLSPMAEEALSAIQRAAGNMADVVNMLEDKIRGVVSKSSAA